MQLQDEYLVCFEKEVLDVCLSWNSCKGFLLWLGNVGKVSSNEKIFKAVVLQKHRSIYDAGITRRFPSLFSSLKARLIPNVNKRRGLDFRTPNHPKKIVIEVQ